MNAKKEQALIQRINRRLDGLKVRACRKESRDFLHLGRFYMTDANNILVEQNVDLNKLLKDLRLT